MKLWKKILLGILLGILIILLSPLILLLVFTPLRYAVVARVGDGTVVRVKASYLFRALTVRFLYRGGEVISQMRIFGIRVGGGRTKISADMVKPKPHKSEDAMPIAKNEPANEFAEEPTEEPAEMESPDDPIDETPETESEKSSPSAWHKLRRILTYPELKIIIGLVLTCLKRFLRVLLPKRFDIVGLVGFDDPATTGMALGAYESIVGMLNLRQRIRLAADFTKPGVRLKISAGGGISAARMLRPLISLYMKKPVRRFIKFLRKGDLHEQSN
ncbi:MAG: DUF2953 domain-containing protein [Defluviitaleaceae bacterium]|nr:DUF2953 domain-containing protein [Defluviitaleaceae bacterium]